MLCPDGKLSIYCFAATAVVAILTEIYSKLESLVYFQFFPNIWCVHLLHFALVYIQLLLCFRGFKYQVATRAAFLGYVFGTGISVAFAGLPSWKMFGLYAAVLAFFHYSEFLSIAWTNPRTLSIDSFILNHSVSYAVAACSSWLEYITERYFYPTMKEPSSISYFGLILCISGEILRKLAMFTAKHNFNHIVQSQKTEDHELVTHGVYRLFRHPSYVGWFYWSIGTQLILQNPFCFMAYALTSWRFFHDRILIEELTLIEFFGDAYTEYQKKVGTGLPFISGFKVNSYKQ